MVMTASARRYAALLAVVLLCAAAGRDELRAQDVRLTAAADTTVLRVGEQVRVTVSLEHPAGFLLRNLGPADSLDGLEIVGVDSVASSVESGGGQTRHIFTFTAFDSGTYVVPPFIAYYTTPPETLLRSVSGGPIVLFVRGVDVDTSAEIRAIKPPLDVPLTFAELLPYLLGIVGAVVVIWLVYYILKKRKRGEKFIPGPPPRPADEIALDALRSIAAEKLWQRGMVKEYHTALSDVIRTYIERRFLVPAMESTSDEILADPTIAGLVPDAVAGLRDALTRSDLVKFAKFIPQPEQNERSIAESVSFVELTRKAKVAPRATDDEEAASPTPRGDESAAPDRGGDQLDPDAGEVK